MKLILSSFYLDILFLQNSTWSPTNKIELLLKKYYLILIHFLFPFKFGISHTILQKHPFYYHSHLYGLAAMQNMHAFIGSRLQTNQLSNINTIVDVGASVGNFTLLAHHLYPQANIYSFEPQNDAFNCLKKNTAHIPNASTHNFALSDKDGTTKITSNGEKSAINPRGSIAITTTTLDHWIQTNKIKQIDLLKIDTEMHELHILKGAKQALPNTKYLLIEITVSHNPHYTFSSLIAQLSTSEYNFQLIDHIDWYESKNRLTMMDCLFINQTKEIQLLS